MKITIAILAWNEEKTIAKTLASLMDQSLFTQSHAIDLLVIPNGSTDATAEYAKRYLSQVQMAPHVRWRIAPVATPGKANAWNILVHELSDPCTDIYLFMDADIEINEPDALQKMLWTLNDQPQVIAVSDLPQKHVQYKKHKNPLDLALEGMAKFTHKAKAQLCGQLYGLRGPFARTIWLPMGLIVEDGFLKEFIVTNGYRQSADAGKIARAENASHVFKAYTRLSEIFRHQQRQAIGQAMNFTLKTWLMEQLSLHPDLGAGEIVRQQNALDPNWLMKCVQSHTRRWWSLYPGALTHRFKRLLNVPIWRRLALFPLALAGFLFDLPVFLAAHHRLRQAKTTQDLWKKI